MIINLVETDPSNASASSAIKAAWQQAANLIGSMFTDNITININVTYGVANSAHPTSASAWPGTADNTGTTVGQFVSYQTVYNYLTAHAGPGDTSFVGLPNATSIQGQSSILVFNAQLKAMGLLAGNAAGIDGSVDFGTGISVTDMVQVALHEITHALGRVPYGPPGGSGTPDIFDLFRYTSPGVLSFDGHIQSAAPSYFSINGGLTKWADYGQHSDPSDLLNTFTGGTETASSPLSPEDAFNQFYDDTAMKYLSPFDLEQMDVLGFHLKFNAPAAKAADFSGDGTDDLLLETSGGVIEYDRTLGGVVQNTVTLTTQPGWTVVGHGKIAGGPDADVVIQNGGSIWYEVVTNGANAGFIQIGNVPGWKVVGVADVNLDHFADVVIQNTTTDEVGYANMHNGVFNNWFSFADPVGWNVPAVADINHDGFPDLIIQNKVTDEIGYGNLNNGHVNNWVSIADPVGWKVVGAGDVDRNGFDDIVLQNRASGQIIYAAIQNGALGSFVTVGSGTLGWNVVGVEDVLGNGYGDIVIQNGTTGAVEYADMTGGTFHGFVFLANPGITAHTSGAPDLMSGLDPVQPSVTDLLPSTIGTPTALGMPDARALSAADSTPSLAGMRIDGIGSGSISSDFADRASGSLGLGGVDGMSVSTGLSGPTTDLLGRAIAPAVTADNPQTPTSLFHAG